MIQIRQNVFETNSSSVHSITMCMKSDYDRWKDGTVYFYNSTYKLPKNRSPFFTWEELLVFLKDVYGCTQEDLAELIKEKDSNEDEFEHLLDEYEFYTYDSYENHLDYEHYEESFTTPSGETVVSFGYSGENY